MFDIMMRAARKVRPLVTATGAIATALFGQPAAAQDAATATAIVHGDTPAPRFERRLFGQFAEHLGHGIYTGIWVGKGSRIPNVDGYRRDVLDALKAIRVPVIRWPGGCFADEYHWREGIGPEAKRKVKINTNWGSVTEDNSFGTNEFMNYSEAVGADAYVSGNVGDAPPFEMAEWVEYMTSPTGSTLAQERAANGRKQPWKLAMFGIGNELWGCGGNMRPEYAADLTRRYGTFLKPAGQRTMKIASGPNEGDYNWTEVMMRQAGGSFDGIGMHYYTIPYDWHHKGAATDFDEDGWARTLVKTERIEDLIAGHAKIMDKYDPAKRVALLVDEWGTWYDVEPGTNPGFLYQQNSLRDALVASLNFDIFSRHTDRLRGANIAQMVNVLQAMLLTDDKGRMVKTPTYWVFDLYKDYQDGVVLPVDVQSPWYNKNEWTLKAVSASAVRGTDGAVHMGLTNVDPNRPITVTVKLDGVAGTGVTGRVLTAAAMDAHNSFDAPDAVVPAAFAGASLAGGTLTVALPAKSVAMLDIR